MADKLREISPALVSRHLGPAAVCIWNHQFNREMNWKTTLGVGGIREDPQSAMPVFIQHDSQFST
jgi:hypothetical protein